MPENRPGLQTGRISRSAARQWTWIGGAVVLVVVAIIVTVLVVPRHTGAQGRHVVERKTASEVFSGGLAVQPGSISQPRINEMKARAEGETKTANSIAVIANQPVATWLTGTNIASTVHTIRTVTRHASAEGKTAVFVFYAVPDRDCGGYSSGGLTPSGYHKWVKAATRAMEGSHAVVLLEPDSIAQISNCHRLQSTRIPLLKRTVDTLSGHGLSVYLDGGNENRVPVATMAKRLRAAGIDKTQGFFTNVSNFYRVGQERSYANTLADRIGGNPHFVIDVSRNGKGWKGTWCNPHGAGLGQTPRVTTSGTRLDALLWVKTPGLSDGTCNGGPTAGTWWQSYALALVANRAKS